MYTDQTCNLFSIHRILWIIL